MARRRHRMDIMTEWIVWTARRAVPAACALALVASPLSANAHGFAGKRFFPATPSTEDPAVADELSLPIVTRFGDETTVSAEFAKRLTRTFGISVGGEWKNTGVTGEQHSGFSSLETAARWQFLTSAEHEILATAGVAVEWGGVGASDVGGEETTVVAPSLAFGKGFGDLPDSLSYLKPFAFTGLIEYARPVHDVDGEGEPIPTALEGGASIQYSLPYLVSQVSSAGVPKWAKGAIPLVEFVYDAPIARNGDEKLSATIRPGILYVTRRAQFGAEAIIPANDAAGDRVGFLFQVHIFIDDLFPKTIGRPLIRRFK